MRAVDPQLICISFNAVSVLPFVLCPIGIYSTSAQSWLSPDATQLLAERRAGDPIIKPSTVKLYWRRTL